METTVTFGLLWLGVAVWFVFDVICLLVGYDRPSGAFNGTLAVAIFVSFHHVWVRWLR